jgi:hypothetical protein
VVVCKFAWHLPLYGQSQIFAGYGIDIDRERSAAGSDGHDGSYSSVWRHAQDWDEQRGSAAAEAYIPLSFAPGEAYQFDWSHEVVLLDGVTVTVKVAHRGALQNGVLIP